MTERKVGESAGNRGKGRKKGVPNRMTAAAKEAIAMAFEDLGGVDGLVKWAKSDPDNQKAFYTQVWPKIVPLQVNGSHDVNVVDRTELLRRAGEEVRGIFGERTAGDGLRAGSGSLPH